MIFYTKFSDYRDGKLYKILLHMRLIFIFLVTGLMHATAAIYGQQINLQKKNVAIKQIFKEVKIQTGYDVVWMPSILDANRKLDVSYKAASLTQVLDECIRGEKLIYEIQDHTIVIKPLLNQKRYHNLQDSVIYRGKITDENNRIMPGATIRIVGSSKSTFSNHMGEFSIYGPVKGTLEITYIGYATRQLTLNNLNPSEIIKVRLSPGSNNLGQVDIVSTGYQEIAKERATGSFEVITKEQLQHSTDPNLIKRLEGITTSLNFNNNLIPINSASSGVALTSPSNSPVAKLNIRGKNTLDATNDINNTSGQVLVVIDGIASPYSIDNVDPNDVESITILKDAAAASIWGSRAANGVIVVKTKIGTYNRPLSISFNTNFSITEKLDLFYKDYMSTSEYIDGQIYQFNAANTNVGPPNLTTPQAFMSPVAEILNKQRRGEISPTEATAQLNILRSNDVRNDFEKYIIRDAISQNYSLAFDGGSKKITYRLSGAYNKNINNSVKSGGDRLALGYNTSLNLIKNLEVRANINFVRSTTENQAQENYVSATIGNPFYPYSRLADDNGNPLAISFKYRPAFLDLLATTYTTNIQNLQYVPLDNINEGYVKTKLDNLNFNFSGLYKISDAISANVIYNYNISRSEQNQLNRQNSFYMRDLTTFFTTPATYVDPANLVRPLTKQIPLGGLYRPNMTNGNNYTLRGQLNINKNWTDKHMFNAVTGIDLANRWSLSKNFRYYGYDENTLTSNNQLNFLANLTTLFRDPSNFLTSQKIPYTSTTFSEYRVRTFSMYANAAYTYNKRYTISGSVRKDQSSEFGSGTNKSGTPYYSAGASWNIANEDFYSLGWLPRLQLRGTFGYNGNVNPQVSSKPYINNLTAGNNGLVSVSTDGATNTKLRPEKTAIWNLGLDYGVKNGKLSGSLEYYKKHTTDLLAVNPVDPTTGFSSLTINGATLDGWGTDFTLNSQNVQRGLFSWSSNFLLSYNRVKVTKLFTSAAKTAGQVITGSPRYSEGYDLSRLFAFKWAGLDHSTGSPMGYYNGQPIIVTSSTLNSIGNQPISTAKYFGSAVPVYFGSFRNTFNYGAFSISANLLYKLGYYFFRPISDVVRYGVFFNQNIVQGAEFSRRWQKPGDERNTNVPSLLYPGDNSRDLFYQFSEINVQKADHIRLQEINLSYSINRKNWILKNPRFYGNVSNLGVIWRANKFGLDPDINDYPNPRTLSFGFSANF